LRKLARRGRRRSSEGKRNGIQNRGCGRSARTHHLARLRGRSKWNCGGGAYCGSLGWLKPGVETPAKIGQRIFFDMKPDGADAWKGSAFNPEDGKTYAGKMSLSGGTLTTAGCAMGGMICKSTTWTKSN